MVRVPFLPLYPSIGMTKGMTSHLSKHGLLRSCDQPFKDGAPFLYTESRTFTLRTASFFWRKNAIVYADRHDNPVPEKPRDVVRTRNARAVEQIPISPFIPLHRSSCTSHPSHKKRCGHDSS